jgi:hypothetical protein
MLEDIVQITGKCHVYQLITQGPWPELKSLDQFYDELDNREVERYACYKNTIMSAWKAAFCKDLAMGTTEARPRVMAFSRDVVAASPEPSALTNEFRGASTTFTNNANKLIVIGVLTPNVGNGVGTIKSMGFYYGSTATTTVGTGSLGSVINTLSENKDISIELVCQYEVTFT